MSDWKKLSASTLANRIIKSGEARDSAKYIREIASGRGAKQDILDYIMSEDLDLTVFGDPYSKGGVVKSRTGTQDFRKGGMVISTVDNRKNK